MINRSLLCFTTIGAAYLLFVPGLHGHAATISPQLATIALAKPIPPPVSATVIASELQQLRQAYLVLAKADHDYSGHRVEAMHAVEKACDLLGTDIRGDSKNVQPQPTSDAELKQAQQIIQAVESQATSNGQTKVAKHLGRAVDQINTALSLK